MLLFVFATLCARASVITPAFLDAVAEVESGSGRYTVGDGGRAQGIWQMHKAAWQDTTEFRKRKGLPVWSYSFAHDAEVARTYARDYLSMLERQLVSLVGPNVTEELIYAAYNVGFTRLQERGFRIENTPSRTRATCARLRQLLASARMAQLMNAKREAAEARP